MALLIGFYLGGAFVIGALSFAELRAGEFSFGTWAKMVLGWPLSLVELLKEDS